AMQAVVEHFDLPEHYHTLLENVKAQIERPELTIGGRLVTEIEWSSYAAFVSQWELDNYLDLY
ncbi:hypothetical protein ACWH5J_11680, partial [Streptococcus gallolyticus]